VGADLDVEFFQGVKAKPDNFGPCPADTSHEHCIVALWNIREDCIQNEIS
jgi:hypothetical protein